MATNVISHEYVFFFYFLMVFIASGYLITAYVLHCGQIIYTNTISTTLFSQKTIEFAEIIFDRFIFAMISECYTTMQRCLHYNGLIKKQESEI